MVTVTMHQPNEHLQFETPTQAVLKAANAVYTVVDALGRTIGFRKLKALDRFRLMELVGADNANNGSYFGYASVAYSVSQIDGDSLAPLSSKRTLEALVQRLDDEGLQAVAAAMFEQFDQAAEQDSFKAFVKNV